MLKLLNSSKTFLRHITEYTDLKIESELENGDKTLSFSIRGKPTGIQNEQYICTQTDRYVVKEVEPDSEKTSYVCKLDLEALEATMIQKLTAANKTIAQASAIALSGTGWTVSIDEGIASKQRSVQQFKKTPLDCLYKIRDAFMCEILCDSLNQTVYFAERFGQDRGVYFRPELNLVSVSPTFDSYDYYTRIIPIGKDGLTIETVNSNKNYVENYQYSNKIRTLIWEDTSYESAQDLKDDAIGKLSDMSKPKRSYSANVRDLAKVSGKYSILSYGLGDTVHIIDERLGVMDTQRIVKMTEYPDAPEQNEVEISNTVLTWEEMQARLKAAADAWDDVSNPDGTVNGVYVHGVKAGEVVDVEVVVGGQTTTTDLNSAVANVQGDVSGVAQRVSTIEADYLTATQAALTYADITFANIDTANISLAKVKDLYVATGLIRDAVISDAKITGFLDAVTVNAASITAGTLATDRLLIRGTNKSIVYALNDITGALQAQSVDTINGEVLTQRTVNADRIVAGSITANEITTNNLVGTNGWINLRSGTFAFGSDKLTWDGSAMKVGGWTINSDGIYKDTTINGVAYMAFMYAPSNAVAGTAAFAVRYYDTASSSYKYPFCAHYDGTLDTTKLNALGGSIAGWTISDSQIYKSTINSGTEYRSILNAPGTISDPATTAFCVATRTNNGSGTTGNWSYPFMVKYDGSMAATKGTIAGWTISSSGFTANSGDSYLDPAGNFALKGTTNTAYIADGNIGTLKRGTSQLGILSPNLLQITDRSTSVTELTREKLSGLSYISFLPNYDTSGHGGYIDFHYNQASSWTNRIVAGNSIVYVRNSDSSTVNGNLRFKTLAGEDDKPAVASVTTAKELVSHVRCSSATGFGVYGLWNTDSTWKYMYASMTTSDPRLKDNIRPTELNALELVKKIPLYQFDWKADGKHWGVGFIAPELIDIDPALVHKPDEKQEGDMWGVEQFYLVGVLTKAIQELTAEINTLKKQIRQRGG